MSQYAYLTALAEQTDGRARVRIWENKQVIIRRNQDQNHGLMTKVWDAWLRQELRDFSGFTPIIEVDILGQDADVQFFSEAQLAQAVHLLLQYQAHLPVE
ncbi:hypothetical protein [Lacticaseibacillus saniviri]|uniref:Uncharacterized protein n=1 Tax=Lacticaseibacillus saniviri JCM 17471 = DSM 24301 TaxID=1293598 RepID=A0A0R2MS70_9LACO|nr:hypothetical protein [Lacticaseibacillus saniviri]KRO16406.1 hypothetical protein IV56_GL001188 [Lacticaseibacillus saniviri JCM 17471 = DSM 24301]MCG4282865.1 hypothetical protein [Lacticaseibacillus saniviri]